MAHNSDKSKKIKYETGLIIVMRRFFKKVANDLEKAYASNQQIIDPVIYSEELYNLLRQHYLKVQKYFSTYVYQTQLSPGQQKLVKENSQAYEYALLAQIPSRIKFIINTIKKDIALLFKNNALELTPNTFKKLFLQAAFWRAKLIGITETQNAAELKKHTQAQYISVGLGIKLLKVWFTILDGRERPWHGAVSLQRTRGDGLFTVAGQFLLHPGDITHGATAANICNCRCSALYFSASPMNKV